MKKMKITEARIEAKRRWGIMAFAVVSRIHKTPDKKGWMKGVGKRIYFPSQKLEIKEYFGWGETWEEAFEKADKKGEK